MANRTNYSHLHGVSPCLRRHSVIAEDRLPVARSSSATSLILVLGRPVLGKRVLQCLQLSVCQDAFVPILAVEKQTMLNKNCYGRVHFKYQPVITSI